MGLSAVSNAIAAFLAPSVAGITNYGTIYQALPKVANEQDLFLNSFDGAGLGATIYLFPESQREDRIALGGPHDGRKIRNYVIGLLIVFKSDLSKTVDGQLAFNTFMDQLTTRIQSDRNAGDPSVIFSFGEGERFGGADLEFQYFVPRTLKGGVTIFQSVGHVFAVEIINT